MITFKKAYLILLLAAIGSMLGCQNKIDITKLVQATISEIHHKYYPFTAMDFQDEWEDAVIDGNIELANQKRNSQLKFIQSAIDAINHKVAEINTIASNTKLSSLDQDYLNGLNKYKNAQMSSLAILQEDKAYTALVKEFESIHKHMEILREEWKKNYPPLDVHSREEALASYLKQMAPIMDSNFQKYEAIMGEFSSLRGTNYTSSDKEHKLVKIKLDIVHHTLIQNEFARHLRKIHDTYLPQGADQFKPFSNFTNYHQNCADSFKMGLKAVRAELIAQQKITWRNS
jgi:hypothetical protein